MELIIGLVVVAVIAYFVFFRKATEETTSVSVADVAATAEVVEAAPVAVKKPAVKKAMLSEGTEVTGNRESKPEVGLDNILDIRKLAGLK